MPREVEITIEHENIKMSIAETSEERVLYSQANSVFEGRCKNKSFRGMYSEEEEAILMYKFGEYNCGQRAYFETFMV